MVKKIFYVLLCVWMVVATYMTIDLNRRLSIVEEKVLQLEDNIWSLTKNDIEISNTLKLHQEYNDVNTDILEMIYEYLF